MATGVCEQSFYLTPQFSIVFRSGLGCQLQAELLAQNSGPSPNVRPKAEQIQQPIHAPDFYKEYLSMQIQAFEVKASHPPGHVFLTRVPEPGNPPAIWGFLETGFIELLNPLPTYCQHWLGYSLVSGISHLDVPKKARCLDLHRRKCSLFQNK